MTSPQLQRALVLLEQGRHELAIPELRQVLATDPDAALPHALLAVCLVDQEHFAEAQDEAQRAIALAPDLPFAHYALAHVLHDRRDFDRALVAVREAIRLEPEDADFHALEAQLHLANYRWAEALAAAERGLQVEAQHVASTNLRAVALVKLGRKAEAGATIESALARDPDNTFTHANQGWTLLEQGNHAKALEHFREAMRLDPQNDWARQGIIESLKARHFIYSVMLRYFLWMAKLPPNWQLGVILGGWLGNRLLGAVAKSNPALQPWVFPLQMLYLAFALLTWTAEPLFNLLLRLNKFGRLALSEEQTRETNWVGACVGLALASVLGWLVTGAWTPWVVGGLVFVALLIPLTATFKCQAGWPRRMMGIYTAFLAVLGVASLVTGLLAKSNEVNSLAAFDAVLGLFAIGAMLSPWVANGLMLVRPRR